MTKIIDKIKTLFMFNNFFFTGNRSVFCDNAEKDGTDRQATDDNIMRCMRFACRITTATDTQSE